MSPHENAREHAPEPRSSHEDCIRIEDLLVRAVVGLHEWERRSRQDVLLSVTLFTPLKGVAETDRVTEGLNYAQVCRAIIAHVEASSRYTIETLATDVAGISLGFPQVSRVRVRLAKPGAERYARAIAVELERTREDLSRRAYVLMGSNHQGEEMLPRAAGELTRIGVLEKLTGVYESAASGKDGPHGKGTYLNAAACLRTTLPGAEITRRLKTIEDELGRVRDESPRVLIDLDLCMLDAQVVEAMDAALPHKQLERPYAAALVGMLDGAIRHPVTGQALQDMGKGEALLRGRPDVLMP